ncbi:endonuclease/exonuclease/phosphatase family protein [Streptomyces sp. NPDC047315]|uniref:endonuclease/exonuclease/phosphatase family protein n=1 Tax=Streptomyces sp. NPDC047315 TaxID=3155142 RepID=UPI0033C46822
MPKKSDEFTIITFNLEHDGGPDQENGDFPQAWHDAHNAMAAHNPDILLRQETTYSRENDCRRLKAAGDALDMRGFLGQKGSGRNPTGLFIQKSGVVIDVPAEAFEAPCHHPWRTPPTRARVHLPEVPETPIDIMSWHFAFTGPVGRSLEIEQVVGVVDKVKKGHFFIGGGDCNDSALDDSPIHWDTTTDGPHVVHRTLLLPDGSRVTSNIIDRQLTTAGLVDPARYIGTPAALAPTGGRSKAARGQGGHQRIDRIYITQALATVIEDFTVIDTTGYSDHNAVKLVLSRKGMVEVLKRAA